MLFVVRAAAAQTCHAHGKDNGTIIQEKTTYSHTDDTHVYNARIRTHACLYTSLSIMYHVQAGLPALSTFEEAPTQSSSMAHVSLRSFRFLLVVLSNLSFTNRFLLLVYLCFFLCYYSFRSFWLRVAVAADRARFAAASPERKGVCAHARAYRVYTIRAHVSCTRKHASVVTFTNGTPKRHIHHVNYGRQAVAQMRTSQ